MLAHMGREPNVSSIVYSPTLCTIVEVVYTFHLRIYDIYPNVGNCKLPQF